MTKDATTQLAGQVANSILSAAAREGARCQLTVTTGTSSQIIESIFDGCDEHAVALSMSVDDQIRFGSTLSLGAVVGGVGYGVRDEFHFETSVISLVVCPTAGIRLRLVMPQVITVLPRRKSFRLPVSVEDDIRVRVWRIDKYVLIRDKPAPSAELKCELIDIGPGGLRMKVFATRAEALAIVEHQRLRIEVQAGKSSILMEGQIRYPKSTQRDDASAVCGVSFVHREQDIDYRRNSQKLSTALSLLERTIARRRQVA
jgi:hypothetical protein